MTKSEALYFTAPRCVEVRSQHLPELGPKDVLIEAAISGISAGTELNVYRGLAPQWRKRRDPDTLLFTEVDGSEWTYPARYGYAMVGHVRDTGSEVNGGQVGDLVFAYAPHGRHAVVPEASVVPLDGIEDPRAGVFFANLNTAYNGVLDARPPLGASVVVSGLGVIGQLVVRLLARAALDHLIAVDMFERRRNLAIQGGATHTLDPQDDRIAEAVRELTHGRGADVVIEVSGAPLALNEAIRCAGYNGLVVAMSWYGGSFASLDLSGEFHHNRIRIVSSQVARVNPEIGPLWTVARRQQLTKHYLAEFDLAGLVSHLIPFERAPEAYALLDGDPGEAMQVVLTY